MRSGVSSSDDAWVTVLEPRVTMQRSKIDIIAFGIFSPCNYQPKIKKMMGVRRPLVLLRRNSPIFSLAIVAK